MAETPDDSAPRFNIAPTQPIPVVIADPFSGENRRVETHLLEQ